MKFSYDDSYLFSTGGNDKCVIVWKTNFGKQSFSNESEKVEKIADVEENDTDVIKTKVCCHF